MPPRSATSLQRLRQDLAACLCPEAITAACRAVGHLWKDGVLNPVTTVHRFLLQILEGNTACQHVVHFDGRTFTDAATGFVLEALAFPLRTHDISQATQAHTALQPGDVLVGDRGFCSFVHLASLVQRKVHAVFRIHQRQFVDFTPNRPHVPPGHVRGGAGLPRSRGVRLLGTFDQVVEWIKPHECPAWMTAEAFAALPASLLVRELRYRVDTPGFRTQEATLVTTLVDSAVYPQQDLAHLYFRRWRVELDLRDLKQTMKMDILKCKTVDGVMKEQTMYALAYKLVRAVALEAARCSVSAQMAHRVS